jgi:hypothetical protein
MAGGGTGGGWEGGFGAERGSSILNLKDNCDIDESRKE